MFRKHVFKSHSGLELNWKIECDDLTQEDIDTLAFIISNKFKFGSVYGIPNGGIRMAKALDKYSLSGSFSRLLVDDVLTTGGSMEKEYKEGDIGVVIFSRGKCPSWITPIFQLSI